METRAVVASLALIICLISLSLRADNPASPDVALAISAPNPKIEEKLGTISLSLQFNGATLPEAMAFLTMKSKDLDPDKLGVDFVIQPDVLKSAKPITLSLQNVSLGTALQNICKLANVKFKTDNSSVQIVSPLESTNDLVTQPAGETGDITHKLQTIIVPEVKWTNLDIAVAVQFLSIRAKQMDPDKKGVNFVLGDMAAGKDVHREITFTATKISLIDLLVEISKQTNLRYFVEDGAVYFKP